MFVSCIVFVLSGRDLCDGPIPRPEESYRLWCVFECDQVKNKILDTCCEQVGRRGGVCETKPYTVSEPVVSLRTAFCKTRDPAPCHSVVACFV
jgi:hypothetical protein